MRARRVVAAIEGRLVAADDELEILVLVALRDRVARLARPAAGHPRLGPAPMTDHPLGDRPSRDDAMVVAARRASVGARLELDRLGRRRPALPTDRLDALERRLERLERAIDVLSMGRA
jgi:hypothetical protein